MLFNIDRLLARHGLRHGLRLLAQGELELVQTPVDTARALEQLIMGTDFLDGTDLIGLADGLVFADLTIDQSADVIGDGTFDTVISVTATAEILATLDGIDSGTTIDQNDFVIVV